MLTCKHCGWEKLVKHGLARGKQRYWCKGCSRHFVEGDKRVKESLVIKRALAVTLYSLAKGSFSMLGKVFGVSRALVYRWIKEEAALLPAPEVPGDIREMEFDEMWHFIGSKKTSSGSSKRWIVAQGEPWPGLQAVVMLRPSGGSTTRSDT
jgi:transposase